MGNLKDSAARWYGSTYRRRQYRRHVIAAVLVGLLWGAYDINAGGDVRPGIGAAKVMLRHRKDWRHEG